MQGYQRMLPLLSDENAPLWTGGADGELRILRCQDCGTWLHPPQPVCRECFSRDIAAEAVSGKGEVFSFTVNCKSWGPGLEVPYIIAIVRLAEQDGLQLTTNLFGIAPEDVRIGMPVRVEFEKDEDVWLPMFRPDDEAVTAA